MNEALIANWNRKVLANDTIFIMGDMFFRTTDPEPILRRVKGKKHLIVGNATKNTFTVLQGDTRQKLGGIFGKLGSDAMITDVVFENATFGLERGSIDPNAEFGLRAGNIAGNATLTNITISGKITIGTRVNSETNPAYLGLLCSSGTFGGIDISNIACVAAEGNENVNIQVDDGVVTLTFNS